MIPLAISLNVLSTIGALCMALIVIAIRLRASQNSVSIKKILIPPLGMSTGFLMFLFPQTHIPLTYALTALMVGVLFSYPLIRTTKMEKVNGNIYLKRSKAFALILLGLLAIRIALHDYVHHYVTVIQTGAVFFILAFGMIAPWRIAMYLEFRQLDKIKSRAWKKRSRNNG